MMKVGAGGLQSLVVYDAMPQRSPADAQAKMNQTATMEMGLAGAAVKRNELVKILERLNNSSKLYNLTYEFLLEEENGEVYVAVVDKNTGEVKRRLPPGRFLTGGEDSDGLAGIMVDNKG